MIRSVLLSTVVIFIIALNVYAAPIVLTTQPDPFANSSPLEKGQAIAYAALSNGDLVTAEGVFKETIKIDPKSAEPYIGLAEVALHRQQGKLVESMLAKAMETDPKNQSAVRALGRYYFRLQNFDKAESSFKQALALNPEEPRLHVDLGDTYLNGLNRPDAAVKAYKAAIKLKDDHVIARIGLAASLAVQGNIQQAIGEYNVAADFAPENPLPLHLLGRLYASQARFDDSLSVLNSLLQKSPNYIPALLERGNVHFANNGIILAKRDYDKVIELEPSNAIAHLNVGTIHQINKKWALAEGEYLTALKLNPALYNAYNNLAWMTAERNQQLDKGLYWIQEAIRISPASSNLYDTLGWVYFARDENELAVKALQKAVKADYPKPGTFYRLGLAYIEVGNKSEAATALKRALEISKDFSEADQAEKLLAKLK